MIDHPAATYSLFLALLVTSVAIAPIVDADESAPSGAGGKSLGARIHSSGDVGFGRLQDGELAYTVGCNIADVAMGVKCSEQVVQPPCDKPDPFTNCTYVLTNKVIEKVIEKGLFAE